MKVLYHPEFASDILEFQANYREISEGLAERFRNEIEGAIGAIVHAPASAGHYLQCDSKIIIELRRKNLKSFPFFILYSWSNDQLVFGSVIPSRSDPLTWLVRFE